ncbi:MAG: hypothetical protein JWL72_2701, partial [Ilumatobacteraceae bacterium]|nr:hypothetical protein [Ilumatobacteraceae bacterium]
MSTHEISLQINGVDYPVSIDEGRNL